MKINILFNALLLISCILPSRSGAQYDTLYKRTPQGFLDLNPERHIRRMKKDSLFGYYNYQTKQWVIEPKYTRAEAEYQQYLAVRSGDREGIIDKKGNVIVPVEYDDVDKPVTLRSMPPGPDSICFPGFIVRKNHLYGFYNTQGVLVLPLEWESASWINDTLLLVSKSSVQCLFNARMEKIFEGHFEEGNFLKESGTDTYPKRFFYARSPETGRMGLLDLHGRVVLPFEFNRFVWAYKNFICAETEDSMLTIYNAQGKQLFPAGYSMIFRLDIPYFMARDGNTNKVGILDTTGRVIVPFNYNNCSEVGWNAPYFRVRNASEIWAVFDINGHQLTDMIFTELQWSGQVLLGRTSDKKWHFLDKNGQFFGQPFDNCDIKTLGIVITSNTAEAAFCSLDGRLLTDFRYKYAKIYSSMKAGAQLAKEKGVPNGKWIIGNARRADGKEVFIDNEGGEHL